MEGKRYLEKFDKLPYGYKWFNGRVMHKEMTDAYNYLTERIKKADEAGMIGLANSKADERGRMACTFVNWGV